MRGEGREFRELMTRDKNKKTSKYYKKNVEE